MLVLPFPGGPYRKMLVPELSAGPTPLEGALGDDQLRQDLPHPRARRNGQPPALLPPDGFVVDFELVLCVAPAYWLPSRAPHVCGSRLHPRSPYVYAPSPSPPCEDLTSINFSCFSGPSGADP